MLASIPSPPSNVIELGPISLRAYGLMIALGVVAAVLVSQKRWVARGGDPDDISAVAMWAVPAGLVGSRVYHVFTDWRFDEGWAEPFKIWEGGLGIPGGMAAGIFAALWLIRRNGWDRRNLLDAMVPSLPLAQAIGRLGNWFNQELFGSPSDLPWAVEIDARYAARAGYPDADTFHPTFLYESLWNLGLFGVLVWVDRSGKIRQGGLVAVYVVGYAAVRIWLETVRIDPATEIGGLRVNIWMSIVALSVAGGWLVVRGRASGNDRAVGS
ncbi:MAG: prolipoprotein diacylglyceryl transferase [Acidimicrobiales bacterium]|jgi:prolipoprotein diacylglyceryl transferase